jgi:Protein of unknown function (DUF2793)/Phage tail repeat like
METTGRFDLPLIMPNQAQKHVTHNEALTLIDGLCHLVIKTFGETAPPPLALLDEAYIVGASATGDWFGEDGNIAFNTDAGWRFMAPRQGVIALNATTLKLVIYNQNIWAPLASAFDISSVQTLGINNSADTVNRFALRSNAALMTAVNVADGGNGDMQLKINKELPSDTASVLFQTGFSGRAEMGLTGDDDFRLKVSPDGSAWTDALHINKTTGVTTLANNSIANAALADMATARFKGRITAGTGDPQDISGTQATTLLDIFSSTLKGVAPASGGGTANFLRADGTWAAPAGGGSSAWGGITGTLSAQTDLQSALAGKSDVAHSHAAATTTVAGFLSATDKAKLDGIANGANLNSSDAALRDRATHTGSQLAATISDFTEAVQDISGAFLTTAGDLTWTYNDAGNTMSANVSAAVVSNAKLANMATASIKGRLTAGTGAPEDLTGPQVTGLLDVFSTTAKGVAPASGGGTANFLRADGTWAAPSGGGSSAWGGITGTLSAQTDLQAALNSKAPSAHIHGAADVTNFAESVDARVAALLIAGTNISLTYDNAANTLAIADTYLEPSPARFYAFTDCLAGLNTPDWTFTVSGTGAAHAVVDFADQNSIGAIQSALGTVATNRTSITSPVFTTLQLGQGLSKFATRLRLATLSDATNTWTLRAGFIDSLSAESTDGVFLRYTNGVNAGKFQAVTRSNNVETAVDTGITATTTTTYKMEVEVNTAGTSAVFKINGTIVATITTNIPTGNGREVGYGLYALRSVGTAAVNSYIIDYILADIAFSTMR